MSMPDVIEDLACCGSFLAMAERQKLMLNGRTAEEAFEAFARLTGFPAGKLRALARDPDVHAIIRKAGG